MRWFGLLFTVVFALSACEAAEKAVEAGNEVVDACAELAQEDLCPVGTTISFDAGAVAECGGSVGGTVGLSSQSAEVSARCGSSGECSFLCVPPSCCGGEEWTDTSYKCDLPCAAACSCDGKCGTVTGVECEADCGGCDGGQICGSDNVCVDACADGVEECGGECCGTVEVCYQNLCCDPVSNCAGKSCGSDGCGGECEDQASIAGCEPGQACDNGTCIADCSGSLDVCDNAAGSEYVKRCDVNSDGVGKWTQGEDCAFDGLFCMNTSTGAVCAECTSNDSDDEDGHLCDEGYCLTTPTGAKCVSCLDDSHCTVDPKLNADGQPLNTCVNGQCTVCSEGPNPEECCATESGLPDCSNEDGTPRNCGDDGCGTGTFCGNQDYACNGIGKWCNPETGSCLDDLAECTFEVVADGEWQQLVIPHGFPMCNSIHPDMSEWILDSGLAAQAVISGSVDMGDPDEIGKIPFDNVCTWKIHEFEVGEDGEETFETLNCSTTNQVCMLKALDAGGAEAGVNLFEVFDSTLTLEDFECLDKSTCADFGVDDEVPFCNVVGAPGYQESMEEGILLKCKQSGDLAQFDCESCDVDGTSLCKQAGWACFTQPANEDDGSPAQGFCAESQEGACDSGDALPQCITDEDGTPAISTCTWDSVTNWIDTESLAISCAEGEICAGYEWTNESMPECEADDESCPAPPEEDGYWHKPISPTCQVPKSCPNGAEEEIYCNALESSVHDTGYDPSTIMKCSVKQESNTVVLQPEDPAGAPCSAMWDDYWSRPGLCWKNPDVGQVSCEWDNSMQCDAVASDGVKSFQSECVSYQETDDWETIEIIGPSTCTYDAVLNEVVIDWEPESCAEGQLCVDKTKDCNPDDPLQCTTSSIDATCQEPVVCAEVPGMDTPNDCGKPALDSGMPSWPCTYCNQEGEPYYEAAEGPDLLTSCMADYDTNQLDIWVEDCSDAEYEYGLPSICHKGPSDDQGSCSLDTSSVCASVDPVFIEIFSDKENFPGHGVCAQHASDYSEEAISTCTYDPVSNMPVFGWDPCAEGLICVENTESCNNPDDPSDCDLLPIAPSCQEPVVCPEVPGMDTPNDCGKPWSEKYCMYCNQEGEPWYQADEGLTSVRCMADYETNQLEIAPHIVCEGDEQCFPGDYVPAHHGSQSTWGWVHGDENSSPDDPKEWVELEDAELEWKIAQCDEPVVPCTAATWCDNKRAYYCLEIPNANWKETDDFRCSDAVPSEEDPSVLVPGNVGPDDLRIGTCHMVNLETGEELYPGGEELYPDGDTLYAPDDAWEAQCLDKTCGPIDIDGGEGEPVVGSCVGLQAECLDVSEGDVQQAFVEAFTCSAGNEDCIQSNMNGKTPSYACVPEAATCQEIAEAMNLNYWDNGDSFAMCNKSSTYVGGLSRPTIFKKPWYSSTSFVIHCLDTADGPVFDFSDGSIVMDDCDDKVWSFDCDPLDFHCSNCHAPDDEVGGSQVKQCVCNANPTAPGCM